MKRILAALSFFTRIPFWRLTTLETKHYQNMVPMWPIAGFLTGGVMALFVCAASFILPINIAVILALISRVILTGGLHEDGFADFCDGFGGSSTGDAEKDRERTLRIMKDSFIGTYGVLGLILYFLLFYNLITTLAGMCPIWQVACVMIIVDVLSKYISSMIVYFLPYVRDAENSKNKLVYDKGSKPYLAMLLSILTLDAPILFFLFRWMKRRINGYTGDCCGATFMIIELYNYLILLIVCGLLNR